MQQFDCLILLHGSDANSQLYIPSKIYEYWWAKRPIFASIHNNVQLESIIYLIHEKNHVIETLAPASEYAKSLKRLIDRWMAGEFDRFEPLSAPVTPESAVRLIIEMLAVKTKYFRGAIPNGYQASKS